MSYVESTLRPNETLLLRGELHWILLIAPALWLLAGGAMLGNSLRLEGVPQLIALAGGGVATVFGLMGAARELLRLWTTEYAVTSSRVVAKHGWIRRTTTSLPGARIESVHVDQTVLGRLFGYGTVTVRGTGDHAERLTFLKNPITFRNAVMDILAARETET